jgi:hypothetical protein
MYFEGWKYVWMDKADRAIPAHAFATEKTHANTGAGG